MKRARTVTTTPAAQSLLTLLEIPAGQRGTIDVILQAPRSNTSDISLGTQAEQPGFIEPGGTATLEGINLRDTFVSGTAQTLIILVLR